MVRKSVPIGIPTHCLEIIFQYQPDTPCKLYQSMLVILCLEDEHQTNMLCLIHCQLQEIIPNSIKYTLMRYGQCFFKGYMRNAGKWL